MTSDASTPAETGIPGGVVCRDSGCLGLHPSSTSHQLQAPDRVTPPASVSLLGNEDNSAYFTGLCPTPHI